MDTLSRAATAQFFPTQEDYLAFRLHWSRLLRSPARHELTATHHLLYSALLGKDWRRGFTPITNRRKLYNGAFLGWSLFAALRTIHNRLCEDALLAPFAGLVTPTMLAALRLLLTLPNPYSYQAADFDAGQWPFPAYAAAEATAHA